MPCTTKKPENESMKNGILIGRYALPKRLSASDGSEVDMTTSGLCLLKSILRKLTVFSGMLKVGATILLILSNTWGLNAFAHPIDMEALKQIESSGNPKALSPDGCRGLFQISEIVLKQFNRDSDTTPFVKNYTSGPLSGTKGFDVIRCYQSPCVSISVDSLFDPDINRFVANWYLNWISQKVDTIDEILIVYNWGIGNFRKWQRKGSKFSKLPKETQNYLKKYHTLTGVTP